MNKLIGKKIIITDKDSQFFSEWGYITDFDGEQYHVSIANGKDIYPIFDRDQFKVVKGEQK